MSKTSTLIYAALLAVAFVTGLAATLATSRVVLKQQSGKHSPRVTPIHAPAGHHVGAVVPC